MFEPKSGSGMNFSYHLEHAWWESVSAVTPFTATHNNADRSEHGLEVLQI